MGRRAVFLDRDGTLNRLLTDPETGAVDSPMTVQELELLPGVASAVRQLNDIGFLVVIASNQPAVGKRKTTLRDVDAITQRLKSTLAAETGARVDAVYYCLHHPEAVDVEYRQACGCRKPAPGLLLKAAAELSIDLASSYMVGDGAVDVLAARRAGCVPIHLTSDPLDSEQCCPDLPAAVRLIASLVRSPQDAP